MDHYGKVTSRLVEELRLISGEKNVIFGDPEKMEDYSHDEIADRIYAHMPDVVVKPASAQEISQIMHLANRERIPVVPRGAGSGLSGGAVPVYGGIVLSLERMNRILEIDKANLVVVVDGVEDPRNLGAVLRTSEAAGVQAVLVPQRHSCGITPTVVQASAGAALHLKLARIGNVVQALEKLKEAGLWVVGLDMEGQNRLEEIRADTRLVVVVGGEHRGVRRLVREHCDFLLALPMRGKVSSLNLSVAAGILLYQLTAQTSPQKRGA